MGRRSTGRNRVLGPYEHGSKWRVIIVDSKGERDRHDFSTEKEAHEVARSAKRELGIGGGKTVDQAIDEYERYMRTDKGNKPESVDVTVIRLRQFFREWDLPVESLNSARATSYYEALRINPGKRGKPLAVDTHRNILAQSRTFLRWCVKKRWLRANPLDAIEGKGKRKHGKAQLRIDEARLWIAKAIELADRGEAGAVAAMMALLMGMRAQEIVKRVVRDLDDGGCLLWIPESKTEAGRRTLQVPALLQPYLCGLAENRRSDELLFEGHWRDWPRKWVQRICAEAGVMKVTAHGMRGLHSTLALEAGSTAHTVAAALGHHSPSVTLQSYVRPEAVSSARQRSVLTVLAGGKTA